MLREVRYLRQHGLEIRVASLRPPDRPLAALSPVEREEAKTAFYVISSGFFSILRAHLKTLCTRPAGYFRGLYCGLHVGMLTPARFWYGLFYFGEAVVLGEWMRRNSLSHLHSHFSSTVALIVARTFPVTMSATFHGPAEFASPGTFQLAKKINASVFSRAISSAGLGQLTLAAGPSQCSKLELTLLGIDPEEFTPKPFRAEPSPFQLITVARLDAVKGQRVLIAAIHNLVQEGRHLRLRFVGDGPDRVQLERDVADRGLSDAIVFTGNLNQDELRRVYRESDIFVLPSFAEGLPVVLMEAMAMEIPCVATCVDGTPELISHERNGILVPPGDAASLARGIARLMDEPDLRRRLAESARQTVLDRFDIRRNTRNLAAIFRSRLTGWQPPTPVRG
jgi:glycosyltransferase involved in cell wall biosynthesis